MRRRRRCHKHEEEEEKEELDFLVSLFASLELVLTSSDIFISLDPISCNGPSQRSESYASLSPLLPHSLARSFALWRKKGFRLLYLQVD